MCNFDLTSILRSAADLARLVWARGRLHAAASAVAGHLRRLAPAVALGGALLGPPWLATPAAAQVLDPATAGRLDAAWPEIEVAADLAQVEPELLAGLLAHETRMQPLAARGHRGPGQIAVRWWGAWLAGEGLDADDLDDPVVGVLAVGRALLTLRLAWGLATDAQLLCVWGSGPSARWWRTCPYQRGVKGAAREVAAWRSAGLLGCGVGVGQP